MFLVPCLPKADLQVPFPSSPCHAHPCRRPNLLPWSILQLTGQQAAHAVLGALRDRDAAEKRSQGEASISSISSSSISGSEQAESQPDMRAYAQLEEANRRLTEANEKLLVGTGLQTPLQNHVQWAFTQKAKLCSSNRPFTCHAALLVPETRKQEANSKLCFTRKKGKGYLATPAGKGSLAVARELNHMSPVLLKRANRMQSASCGLESSLLSCLTPQPCTLCFWNVPTGCNQRAVKNTPHTCASETHTQEANNKLQEANLKLEELNRRLVEERVSRPRGIDGQAEDLEEQQGQASRNLEEEAAGALNSRSFGLHLLTTNPPAKEDIDEEEKEAAGALERKAAGVELEICAWRWCISVDPKKACGWAEAQMGVSKKLRSASKKTDGASIRPDGVSRGLHSARSRRKGASSRPDGVSRRPDYASSRPCGASRRQDVQAFDLELQAVGQMV
eukprot:36885-Pelagomonas_calceolata.AAC.3